MVKVKGKKKLNFFSEDLIEVKEMTEEKKVLYTNEQTQQNEVAQGLDDDNSNDMIALTRENKILYTLPRNYLLLSRKFKASLEEDLETKEIPCDSIDEKSLEYIIAYLNLRKGQYVSIGLSDLEFLEPKERKQKFDDEENDEGYIVDDPDSTQCDYLKEVPEDVEFINKIPKGPKLDNLALSASNLDIPCLLHLCGIRLATLMVGIPVEHLERYMHEEEYQTERIMYEEDPELDELIANARLKRDRELAESKESKSNDD
jgi:hypothetical protein